MGTMPVIHADCAGLDVHKRSVVACVLHGQPNGVVTRQVRTFRTMTAGLAELATWLHDQGCTHVAMEATGADRKPVDNVLEATGHFTLLVVNAEHLRAVPGRKTDVQDAEWLATLLRHGLVKASYIPERWQREVRELTRYRTALIRERAREVNRLQKTLEAANLKLAAVLTDVLGVSGQRILDALVAGADDPATLADLAHHRVQKKRQALEEALVGQLTGPLRFVVQQQLQPIRAVDAPSAACDAEVAKQLAPFAATLEQLQTIPGIGVRTAQVLVVELGVDMTRFPTHRHAAAWAGMCPGNRQSGGKRRPARTRKGSPWLRAALVEAAWGASKKKGTYLAAQYRRVAARRGKKRALVAVGHSLLVIAYHVLAEQTAYTELGPTFFDQRDREAVTRRAVHRLEALGYHVQLMASPEVA